MRKYQHILDFWFEGVDDQTLIDKKKNPFRKWFKSNEELDEEIRHNFADDIIRAREGEYKSWEKEPKGALALIILYDQMNRNIHRGTPQMYMLDCCARRLCEDVLTKDMDKKLMLIERVFIYMPLMHTEIFDYQDCSVRMFTELHEEAQQKYPYNQDYYSYHLRFAREAYNTINEHGRFVRRDTILGRESKQNDVSLNSDESCI